MLTIAPQKPFLVDIKLNNPSDTDTHYARAIIKNSLSGVILDSLDLDDQGNRYFSKEWITPADVSGTGLQISIDITVYDDSGYSSESLVYGTLHETYIIREMPSPRMGFAGGSSLGAGKIEIDYEKVKIIIREVLAEMPVQEYKEIDLNPVLEALNSLQSDNTLFKVINDLEEHLNSLEEKIGLIKLDIPEDLKNMPQKVSSFEDYRDDLHKFIENLSINSRKDLEDIRRLLRKKEPEKISGKPVEREEKKEKVRPAILKLLGNI